MPTSTYIALANTTLTGSDAEVAFASIPSDYRDLVLVATGLLTTTNLDILITINSDTTAANYSRVTMSGTGSTTSSITTSPTRVTDWGYWTNANEANLIINLMDYSATDKHKTLLTRANRASAGLDAIATRWASTNAINSVSLKPNSGGSFDTGSTFALYGIVS